MKCLLACNHIHIGHTLIVKKTKNNDITVTVYFNQKKPGFVTNRFA